MQTHTSHTNFPLKNVSRWALAPPFHPDICSVTTYGNHCFDKTCSLPAIHIFWWHTCDISLVASSSVKWNTKLLLELQTEQCSSLIPHDILFYYSLLQTTPLFYQFYHQTASYQGHYYLINHLKILSPFQLLLFVPFSPYCDLKPWLIHFQSQYQNPLKLMMQFLLFLWDRYHYVNFNLCLKAPPLKKTFFLIFAIIGFLFFNCWDSFFCGSICV